MFWSITLYHQPRVAVSPVYKGMHSITCSLFPFKVYIGVYYGESNNQHAHVIRGSDSIKINLALVPFL